MTEISIVIPTFNEAENIRRIVEEINSLGLDAEIIVVDDDSPDGTGDLADGLKESFDHLQVIRRKGERGLASAVVEGFKAAGGEIIGVMDADLSHPVETISKMLEPIKADKAEIVVGSRYVKGGRIVGWNLIRKLTSRGAILLAHPLTPVKDCVSGFFFMKKEVIRGVELNPKGYKIGLEVLVKGRYEKVVEVPYTFVNRKAGKSKLSIKEYVNYLKHLYRLYLYKLRENVS